MARRLNFTARKRILREHVQIQVYGPPAKFFAKLDLAPYALEPTARVVIEAYHRSQVLRFDLGTVTQPTEPADPNLDAFGDPDIVKFRVKIVSTKNARLLAVADRLKPRASDAPELRRSILPVESVPGLREVWRLDMSDGPLLQVSSDVLKREALLMSREFRSLVLPIVLRMILKAVVHEGRLLDEYADDEWQRDWVLFAKNLAPVDQRDEEKGQWIEDVVVAFARRNRVVESFMEAFEGTI